MIGAFITGLPGETVETIRATTEYARKLPLRRYTITLPKPFPKTPFYEWLKSNGYLKGGRPNYPHLSTEEIYRWNKWSLRRVYFSHNYLFRMLAKPSTWPSLFYSVRYFLPYVLSGERQEICDLEW